MSCPEGLHCSHCSLQNCPMLTVLFLSLLRFSVYLYTISYPVLLKKNIPQKEQTNTVILPAEALDQKGPYGLFWNEEIIRLAVLVG